MKKMQLLLPVMALSVLGLTLGGCTTSSSPPPQSLESVISSPLEGFLEKAEEK